MAGKDTNTGAKRARETRSQLALGDHEPIPCVLSIVEEALGLPVVIAGLPEGIAGCCWREGERVVLWVNGTQAAVRQRFTLAHEVGHVRCGHDQGLAVDTLETLAGKTTDSREIQANAFAAELLAPASGVRSMLDGEPTLEDVVRIAARFGVSTIAALFRLNTLGLTTRYDRLRQEIDAGLHLAAWDRVAEAPMTDLLSELDRDALPRLSPALGDSALAAMVAGAASVQDVAVAAGCSPAELSRAAATIGT